MCEHTAAIKEIERDLAGMSTADADRFHDQAMRELNLLEEQCARECHGNDPESI